MINKEGFSIIHGYSFSFEDEGQNIIAWFSSFSSLEKVYVNGKEACSQKKFSKKTSNTFSIGDDSYTTTLDAKRLFIGPYICTLEKNGEIVGRKKLVLFNSKEGKNKVLVRFVKTLLILVVLWIVFEEIASELGWPKWSTYIFLACFGIIGTIIDRKSRKSSGPTIEEEEIV